MKSRTLARKAVAALAVMTFLFPFVADVQAAPPEEKIRTITVEGVAARDVLPNRAKISFGLVGEGKTALEAKQEHDIMMNRVAQALRSLGIPDEQITTDNFSINPVYTNPKDGTISRIGGYRVSNFLIFRTDNIDLLTKALEAAVNAGANTVYNIEFTVDGEDALYDALLADATRNGKRNAETVARAAGSRLGRLVSANIYNSGGYMMRKAYSETSAANGMGGTPIYSGTQKVSVRVNLEFEII